MELLESQIKILQLLAQEPWLTPEQLMRWHGRGASRVQADLNRMLGDKLVQRVNPRSGWIPARAVFALTDRGVDVLASQKNSDAAAYRQVCAISRARHVLLLWRLDRVWNARNLMLSLDGADWRVKTLKSEEDDGYTVKEQRGMIHLHGRGMVVHDEGWFLPFVVEWDSWNEPVDRKRLGRFSRWLNDPRFRTFGFEMNLPTLLVVAADAWRWQEIWDLYVCSPRERWFVSPPMYLTTAQQLRKRGANADIWFSSRTHELGPVFADAHWQDKNPKVFGAVPPARVSRLGIFQEKALRLKGNPTAADLLQMKLALTPVAKRVFHWVLRYPLLAAGEIAWLGNETLWRVKNELRTLEEMGLLRAQEQAGERYFVLSPNGWRYAAAEAGHGRAIRRFTKRRGSVRSVRRLVFHLEHTRATNQFFLKWNALARELGVYFEWRAEAECAVYFRWQEKLHAWLPDGMGIWDERGNQFVFMVELDRTRESQRNLEKKFLEYYTWEEWKVAERIPGIVPEVLIVTTSWQRAERVRALFDESRLWRAFPPLSLWMTTFDAIEESGLAGSIWKHNGDWTKRKPLPFNEGNAST